MEPSVTNNQEEVPKVFTGQCKWFNDRCGYGFISYSTNDDLQTPDRDIFVHYTNIKSKNSESYKALQSGEYVQFNITNCDTKEQNGDNTAREQAIEVTGINNGKLLNEYRNYLSNRSDERKKEYETEDSGIKNRPFGRGRGPNFRGRGRGGPRNFRGSPLATETPKDEWTPK